MDVASTLCRARAGRHCSFCQQGSTTSFHHLLSIMCYCQTLHNEWIYTNTQNDYQLSLYFGLIDFLLIVPLSLSIFYLFVFPSLARVCQRQISEFSPFAGPQIPLWSSRQQIQCEVRGCRTSRRSLVLIYISPAENFEFWWQTYFLLMIYFYSFYRSTWRLILLMLTTSVMRPHITVFSRLRYKSGIFLAHSIAGYIFTVTLTVITRLALHGHLNWNGLMELICFQLLFSQEYFFSITLA